MKRVALVVVGTLVPSAFAACVSQQNATPPASNDGGFVGDSAPFQYPDVVGSMDTFSPIGTPDTGAGTSDTGAASGDSATTPDTGSETESDGAPLPSGALDPGFNGTGYVALSPPSVDGGAPGLFDFAWGIAVDSQQRVLVTGNVSGGGLPAQYATARRLLSTGALDSTFANDGLFTITGTAGGSSDDTARSVCVDGAGNVVMAGQASGGGLAVWRLTSAGVLDPSFGTSGHVLASNGGFGFGVASTSPGILVAGNGSPYGATVWRFTSGGVLDTASFASPNGYAQDPAFVGANTSTNAANALAVDGNGKPIAAGLAPTGGGDAGVTGGAGVLRFTTAGALDTTFNGTGVAVVTASQFDAGAYPTAAGVAVDSSNNVVVAITSSPSIVARFTAAGVLDTTFGAGSGLVAIGLPAMTTSTQLLGLALDSTGRIIVTGFASTTVGDTYMTAWRFTAAGAPDTTFGSGGMYTYLNGSTTNSEGKAVTTDATDHPLVAGITFNPAVNGYTATVWQLTP